MLHIFTEGQPMVLGTDSASVTQQTRKSNKDTGRKLKEVDVTQCEKRTDKDLYHQANVCHQFLLLKSTD